MAPGKAKKWHLLAAILARTSQANVNFMQITPEILGKEILAPLKKKEPGCFLGGWPCCARSEKERDRCLRGPAPAADVHEPERQQGTLQDSGRRQGHQSDRKRERERERQRQKLQTPQPLSLIPWALNPVPTPYIP